MSGDYSRVRFDPRIDLSGVLMQQGRVQLDADWNEWVALLDRRLRAGSVDTFGVHPAPGISGVAVVSPQTPDAFKIEASGGNISIGRGRMYVDGLLAENHGGGAVEFDAVLAELRGLTALAYNQQPYFPSPPALPGGGPHLAYLEVWQREVSYLQQPKLVESAVGVDTTTRLQSVWQVRLLANTGSANCLTPDAEVPGWQALTLPSGGRMSIKAEGVPPDLDPCELPPGGGYRGLENQLYRIEIHDGGAAAAAATFKWSRDNASVASNVLEIVSQTASSTELKLASLGRDALLRFNSGDWVEILDDSRELGGENGDPALRRGVMRKISVDDAKQTISFSPALPANLIPGGGLDTLDARHTRVLRWDQKGTVRDANNNIIVNLDAAGSTGLIPVPAAGVWVVLENGIQIQFSLDPAGGGFHCGDYWVSAARSNDTSVETYTAAPPRGIHRHYARLAIVTFPDGESDCRVPWPPECGGCCTVNVAPGENIQAAIDSLPPEGGCVCLKTGVHNIRATIQIFSSHIILRGESPGTIVRAGDLMTMLQIAGAGAPLSDIVVEGIRFEAGGAPTAASALLNLSQCTRVRVAHCDIAATAQQLPMCVGIGIDNAAEIEIVDNRLQTLLYGVWVKNCKPRLRIAGNLISGPTFNLFSYDKFSYGQYGVYVENDAAADCRIEGNQFADFWTAVYLKHGADGSVVSGNRILRSPGTVTGTMPGNITDLRQYLDVRLYAINVEADKCVVHNNYIDLRSAAWGGVRVAGAEVTVAENTLEAMDRKMGNLRPVTIYCLSSAALGLAADHAVIRDNQALGPQLGIVISRVTGVQVERNHLDGSAAAGWFGLRIDDSSDTLLRDNVLREVYFAVYLSEGERNRVLGNHIDQAGIGIISTQETDLEASGNTLQSCLILGMALFVRGATTLLENSVRNCGYASIISLGIAVYAEEVLTPSGAHLRIEDCEVIDTGISADGSQVTSGNAIGIGGWMPACQISGNRVGYTQTARLDPLKEHRALVLIGPLALHYNLAAGEIAYMFGSAQVNDNHFRGPGRTVLVEFMRTVLTDNIDLRFEKVSFSNNICDHLSAEANAQGASVRLWGGHLIAMGNHIKAAVNVNAMSLSNRNKIALMGNITTGDYINTGTVTPLPIMNFNVKI